MAAFQRGLWRLRFPFVSGCLAGSAVCAGLNIGACANAWAEHDRKADCSYRDSYTYLIAGAGPAGISALRTLQETVPSSETAVLVAPVPSHLVAGSFLQDSGKSNGTVADDMLSHSRQTENFDVLLGDRVVDIDPIARVAALESGKQIRFEKCVLAVGIDSEAAAQNLPKVVAKDARGRTAYVQTAECERKLEELFFSARSSSPRSIGPHVTVVGGSWASICLGAMLVEKGASITFCFAEPAFLARHFPRYISEELMRRFDWASFGAVDSLSYSRLRYITKKNAFARGANVAYDQDEIQVHTSLVFDAFSTVSFRSDFVIFSPTIMPAQSMLPDARRDSYGRFLSNADLSIYADIYAAGSCLASTSIHCSKRQDDNFKSDVLELASWSRERAVETGHHAALNMAGRREPYRPSASHAEIDLSAIGLRLYCLGDQNGSAETFGYFIRSRDPDESTFGGELEAGVLFYTQSSKAELRVTGAVLWDGGKDGSLFDKDALSMAASMLEGEASRTRQEILRAMDLISKQLLSERTSDHPHGSICDASTSKAKKAPESFKHKIVRFHKPPRKIPIQGHEMMWTEKKGAEFLTGGTGKDRQARAYEDLMRDRLKTG